MLFRSFIDVSQYLTEEPSRIIQRIVQSKIRVLTDADRNRQGITENNDYDSFIRFWVYGDTYELRIATVHPWANAPTVVNAVVQFQDIWGIKQANILLKKLEQFNYPDDNPIDITKKVDENCLFESAIQCLSSQLLVQHQNSTNVEILVSNQIHFLQSNLKQIRKNAALILLSLDVRILDILQQQNLSLSSLLTIFSQDDFGIQDDFCYQEVIEVIRCTEVAQQYLSRNEASKYCQELHQKLLWFIKNRKEQIAKKFKTIDLSKQYIINTLNKIRTSHPEVYNDYCNFDFGKLPEVKIEDDKCQLILDEYYEKIVSTKTRIDKLITEEEKRQIKLQNKKREIEIEERNKKTEIEQKKRDNLIYKIKNACGKIHSNSYHLSINSQFSKSKSSIIYNNIIVFYGRDYNTHFYKSKSYEQLKKDYDDLTHNSIRHCDETLEEIRLERLQINKIFLIKYIILCFFLLSPAYPFILAFFGINPTIIGWTFICSIPASVIAYNYQQYDDYSRPKSENHRKVEKELLTKIRENIAID